MPIVSHLRNRTLPEDRNASPRLKVQLSRFILIGDFFYTKVFSRPYLRCLAPVKVDNVVREVHEGVYGNHSGAHLLVHKLIRVEYYWPTMQKDTQSYMKACDKCQHFSNIIRQPSKELTPMSVPWPFTH